MNPSDYIGEAQYAWARRHGITIDDAGYMALPNDNLFLPLIPDAIQEYQAGAGGELQNNMMAAHSSSALVANVFNYWRLYQDYGPIISALSRGPVNYTAQGIYFEVPAPITWPDGQPAPAIPPHLDVVIRYRDQAQPEVPKAIAIESKFRELYSQDQGTFADRYMAPENAAMWEGLEPLHQIAVQIHLGEILFMRLKVSQLIKHILGLKSVFLATQNFELVYLWYSAPGPEAVVHQDEIRRFQQATNACHPRVKFRSIEYHDLIHALAVSQGDKHGSYIEYLQERYF